MIGLNLKKIMSENELIKQLMNKYFSNVDQEKYLELYEHLFDCVYNNHNGYSDILNRKQEYQDLTYSYIADEISNELTEKYS